MIECTMGVNTFREGVHSCSEQQVFNSIKGFITNKRKKSGDLWVITQNEYIERNAIKRIWSTYIDFQGHGDEKYWVDMGLHLPVFASMYNTNIICYGANEVMPPACILTNARCKEVDIIISSKGYMVPA